MILSFKTAFDGKPNYFIEKIWSGIPLDDKYSNNCLYMFEYIKKFKKRWDETQMGFSYGYNPKLHTIRTDSNNRWRSGTDIHFVINSRTKNYFQFAPVVKCVSVQNIEIKYFEPHKNRGFVYVDGLLISDKLTFSLAINDGFDSVEDFFAFFNKDFKGVLIHWTNLKY